jgi:1-pyrroline-4-hydroxy-2-carboxylate deaminase
MASRTGWQGVFPALTTKFTDEGAIDAAACERHFAWQVKSGVDGLIVSGSLGEGSALMPEEKLELVHVARSVAGGRPVILTVADGSGARTVELVRRAASAGADGLMLLPPMMYNALPDETVEWFRTLATAGNLPVMIYNNPVSYKIDVTVPMLEQLAEHENVVAVKESSDDVRRVIAIRNALGERLAIFGGVDNLALESCLMGADGWVAGLVNAFPEETVSLWRLGRAGRLAEALAIYRWFAPVLELDVSAQLVQNIKLAETILGVGNENVRSPRLKLAGAERARVEALLRAAIKGRPNLPALSAAA